MSIDSPDYGFKFRKMVARLFISYVRDDAEADVNALAQTLRAAFGEATIFKDADDIPLGANWKETVRATIETSTAVLWVVGPAWAPSDAITFELRHAVNRGVPVIPVLMRDADIQRATESLSVDLSVLRDLNAATVRHASWERDMRPLVERLSELGLGAGASIEPDQSSQQTFRPSRTGVAPRARMLESGRARVDFELTLGSGEHLIRVMTSGYTRVFVDGRKVKVRTSPRWIKFDVPSHDGSVHLRLRIGGGLGKAHVRALEVNGRTVPVVDPSRS